MDLAKGMRVASGTTLILIDDEFIPKFQKQLGIHVDKMKLLSPWQEFVSYVSFQETSLFDEESGVYVSEGGLKVEVDFETKRILDIKSQIKVRIVDIIETKGIKIITIAGIFITQALKDRFVAAYWVSVGPDVFKLLAKQVNPRDVVRLCGTNQKLRGFCTEKFYAEMLQHHYGQTSKNPGETFRDLAAPAILEYRFDIRMLRPNASKLPTGGDTFVKIFRNGNDTFLLTENGDVWCKGINIFGQLAHNDLYVYKYSEDTARLVVPDNYVKFPTLSNIVDIKLGSTTSFFLDKSGVLRACGHGFTTDQYREGRQDWIDSNIRTPVVVEQDVAAFSILKEPASSILLMPKLIGVYTNGTAFMCKYKHSHRDMYEEYEYGDSDDDDDGDNEFWLEPIIHPSTMVDCVLDRTFIAFIDEEGSVWILLPDDPDRPFASLPESSNLTRVTGLPPVVSIKISGTIGTIIVLLDVNGSVWRSRIRRILGELTIFGDIEQIPDLKNIKYMKVEAGNDNIFICSVDTTNNIFLTQISSFQWHRTQQIRDAHPNIVDFDLDKDSIIFIS
jgi:hypothetical protein